MEVTETQSDSGSPSQLTLPGTNTTLSRLPTARGRPPLPQGPRVRNATGPTPYIPQNQPTSILSPNSANSSPAGSRLASPAPSLPLISETFTAEPEDEHEAIPPSYQESPVLPLHAPFPVPPRQSLGVTTDIGVQAGPSPPLTPSTEAKLAIKVIPKPAALVPPPKINFDSVPIGFKGLPLEAAQWTFTSAELQQVVSRAIRLSARESFIRILSIENLDKAIPDEAERLETLKITTQSQYRFQVHRRTMLLQALNSSATATPHDPGVVCHLAGQLSETTATCDRLMEELLRVADQQTQLKKVQELHWASALAIALRKINKSYERRMSELRGAQDRIEVLEAELEEAWKEAETMAQEIDNMQSAVSDGEDDEDEDDEDEQEEGAGDDAASAHNAEMVEIIGTAVASEARLMSPIDTSAPPLPLPEDSEKEPFTPLTNRSRRSSRSERSSRWSRVAAAKTRSRRTSNASLRVTKRSRSRAGRGSEDKREAPPVPTLPGALQDSSFLDLDSRQPSYAEDFVDTSELDFFSRWS